jgi:flagellar hook-associated protein 1
VSAFGGLTTALSALQAHRTALDVAGQNVANANTEGYSRQRADLQATGGPPVPALFATWQGVGSGVSVSDVTRLRDAFLESRGRAEHGRQSYLDTMDQAYGMVEDIVAEPSDTAIQAGLSEFWAGWHDVANNPGDNAARSQVLQRGAVLADGLNAAHAALSTVWDNSRTDLNALAVEVNTTAAAVAALNQSIQRAQGAGLGVNELADQRDTHLVRLAELVGATALTHDDGTIDVHLGGSALVSGSSVRNVSVGGATRLADQTANPVVLRWVDNNGTIVGGGRIGADLEIMATVVPGHVATLDQVAARLADTVNTQHRAGYGLDGGTDRPFFTGTTASSIHVAVTDPRQLAASSVAGGGLGSSNADDLAALGGLTDGADAGYRAMTASLGVAAQTAGRRAEIQARVTTGVDESRASSAGVNLDEEMTNMLTSQRAYEAAARLMTTVDGLLDVLINRTGLVGR